MIAYPSSYPPQACVSTRSFPIAELLGGRGSHRADFAQETVLQFLARQVFTLSNGKPALPYCRGTPLDSFAIFAKLLAEKFRTPVLYFHFLE
jgi:hypothetical protein